MYTHSNVYVPSFHTKPYLVYLLSKIYNILSAHYMWSIIFDTREINNRNRIFSIFIICHMIYLYRHMVFTATIDRFHLTFNLRQQHFSWVTYETNHTVHNVSKCWCILVHHSRLIPRPIWLWQSHLIRRLLPPFLLLPVGREASSGSWWPSRRGVANNPQPPYGTLKRKIKRHILICVFYVI